MHQILAASQHRLQAQTSEPARPKREPGPRAFCLALTALVSARPTGSLKRASPEVSSWSARFTNGDGGASSAEEKGIEENG